jgi:UDP-2-acetamido-2,6-beta-L-arabino-hexul-4-ose reductase
MNILVTGSDGFIGKNLISELKANKNIQIFEFNRGVDAFKLENYCRVADFIFHLAGVNRTNDQSEFKSGNVNLLSTIIGFLKTHKNPCPIMLSSSSQAELFNPYGISKKEAEDLLIAYSKATGAKILIYRFKNVFGKWCKPNYNSVVATFCHNISHELPIQVDDENKILYMVYIDDVVKEMIRALNNEETRVGQFCEVPEVYSKSLGEIVVLINSFKNSRDDRTIPDTFDTFTKKLYSTYLSYLPTNQFSYELKMNIDNRGSFTEFFKTPDRGQVSVNISKPGITKGNHWHHTKNEKFLVVSGRGVIRFRKIDSKEIHEYYVSGDNLTVVDIPVGYTHNIENLGDSDMVTVMWANEFFDPENPDTKFLEV